MAIIFELKITLDDRGNFYVSGPIHQTMQCYGMIEMAKDSIRRTSEEDAKKVQQAKLGDIMAFAKQ